MEASKEPSSAEVIERLMTSDEVADILHVDPVTIRRLINRSELAAYRIGADYRIAPADLKEYLQRQRIPASAEIVGSDDPFSQFLQWIRGVLREKQMDVSAPERDRFDKFTHRARKVLNLAQEEARRFQHNYIGTEHLLLGLIAEGQGVAANVLKKQGVDLKKIRAAVEIIVGPGESVVEGAVGLTPRAKKSIELAVDEAKRMQHHYIGTEHMLLGLLREGTGIAAGVLNRLGIKLDQTREEILRILEQEYNLAASSEESSEVPSSEEKKSASSEESSEAPSSEQREEQTPPEQ